MNAYTVLLIMVGCEIEARSTYFWPNVGTVLFTSEDLNKQIWPKKDVALLTARRHFQKLIPPPGFISVENEFIDKLLAYFRDSYKVIKTVSQDQETDKIMTTALSDTIGGYLKLCVLPVTKLSFYGGIATYDSAYKVFKFYYEIKKYLCTDGLGWRSPDQKTLNTLISNVPKVVRRKKQMLNTHDSKQDEDPCTSFNYFEKSPNGLVVPMPVVNWDDITMFIPVRNESTFSLHSPKHFNTLENYYNKAKNCMHSKSEGVATEFDKKFQHWLSADVLPHLKDDRLYVALGNVLSLLNQTREMCDILLDMYNSSSKNILPDLKSVACSKTTIIIVIILVFEIIWCIVAIDRLCCKKAIDLDDSDNDKNNRVLSYFEASSNNERTHFNNKNTKEYESNYIENATNKPSFTQKWSKHSNYTEMDRDTNCLSTTVEAGCQNEPSIKCPCVGVGRKSRSQSSFHYEMRSSDVFTIINERIKDFSSSSPSPVPGTITNKSYTKIPPSYCGVPGCDARESCICDSINLCDDSSSTIARTQKKSAITIYRSQKRVEGSQAIYGTRQGKDFQIEKTVGKCKRNEAVLEIRPYSIMPDCYENDPDVSIDLVSVPKIRKAITSSPVCYFSQEEPFTIRKKPKTFFEMPTVISRVDKETETSEQKKKNLVNKSTSSVAINMPKDKKGKQSLRKRYVEIKIDRPKAEIKLGISAGQETPRRGQSKIPTRKSEKCAQNSAIKQPIEVTSLLAEYVDKSINSVIQCMDQSTDYTLTQEYTKYQVTAKEDSGRVVNHTPQNHDKNYSALQSTLLSTQDVAKISKSSNTDIPSIACKQEKGSKTKSDEQDKSLMTIKRSESDSSKISRYTGDVLLPCTNLKQDTKIESRNNGSGIDQETSKMTDKERLIHTIHEHSKEALLSVLTTEEDKSVQKQIVRESCDIVMESTNGSQTGKKGTYNLNKCQVKTTGNKDTSLKLTKTNTKVETSKMSKRQRSTEPIKKINKRERKVETVKTKIPKRSKDNPWIIPRPPETSLVKWKTSVELERDQRRNQRSEPLPTTENVLENPSIILKKSDTYGDTTCQQQKMDGSNGQTNLSALRKSKIPQLMRIDDAHRAKTLNNEVRLNLSF